MTKIDIFSGFLGAGKTTLIKKMIAESFKGEKLVLIENEFGEIGIDGGFLKDAGINISELNSGCICCSLVGDFGEALKKVVEQYHPDRIIIEPSGVGKLSDVIKAVQNVKDDLGDAKLNSFVAVVDAIKAKMYMKNFGEFFNDQIENANTIILSRTQNVSDEKLADVVAAIKEHNDVATIITTPWDQISGAAFLDAMDQGDSLVKELMYDDDDECDDPECECHHHHHHDDDDEHEHHHHHHHDDDDDDDEDEHEHHHHHHDDDEDEHEHEHHHHHHHDHDGHHHHHHADEVFSSWGEESPKKFSEEELKSILARLSVIEGNEFGIILRSKGIVPATEGEWFHFDLTAGEYEVRRGSADYTGRICVIGSELKEDKLKELFGV
ncbi:MAG: GTP-binding protein [Lachnospiraceae bacterium]|nr:GTP-binding protein [Lachnospiraceae bacterium]